MPDQAPIALRLLFLDLDDTLADTCALARRALVQIVPPDYQEAASEVLLLNGEHGLVRYLEDVMPRTGRSWQREWSRAAREVPVTDLQLLPGVRELLDWCSQCGVTTVVVTGAPDRRAREKLGRLGLLGRFGDTLIAGVSEPISRLDAMRSCLANLGMRACDAAVVGDDLLGDVLVPAAAGIYAIWLTRGRPLPGSLATIPRVSTAAHLSHVLQILRDCNPPPAPNPDPEFLAWFQATALGDPTGLGGQDMALHHYYVTMGHVARLARSVTAIKQTGIRNAKALEVGTHGLLLRYLRESGIADDVIGIQKAIGGWMVVEEGRYRILDVETPTAIRIVPEDQYHADASVQLLISLEVIEHIDSPWHALVQWWRACAPGALLILSTPNPSSRNSIVRAIAGEHPYFYPAIHNELGRPTHVRELAPRELRLLLRCSGWELLSEYTFDHEERLGWEHSDMILVEPRTATWDGTRAIAHGMTAMSPAVPRGDYQLVVARKAFEPSEAPPMPIYRGGRPW